jgi:hypothetical protein
VALTFIEVLSKDPVFNNSAPQAAYNIPMNSSATSIQLSGATDPDGDLWSPVQTLSYETPLLFEDAAGNASVLGTTDTPSAVSATGTGSVNFTPNTGATGTQILKYRVCDNATPQNCTAYKHVTINIGP